MSLEWQRGNSISSNKALGKVSKTHLGKQNIGLNECTLVKRFGNKKECLVLKEGFGGIGPTRNVVERRDSAGTVIQGEEVHRKGGASHPVGAALLHTGESLQSNKPGLTLSAVTECLCTDLPTLKRKSLVLALCS